MQEIYPLTGMGAAFTIGLNVCKLSLTLLFIFAFENPSEADPKTAISSALALMARSNPFSLGVNAVKDTPGFRYNTCHNLFYSSAICGTHLELTKLATFLFYVFH